MMRVKRIYGTESNLHKAKEEIDSGIDYRGRGFNQRLDIR